MKITHSKNCEENGKAVSLCPCINKKLADCLKAIDHYQKMRDQAVEVLEINIAEYDAKVLRMAREIESLRQNINGAKEIREEDKELLKTCEKMQKENDRLKAEKESYRNVAIYLHERFDCNRTEKVCASIIDSMAAKLLATKGKP